VGVTSIHRESNSELHVAMEVVFESKNLLHNTFMNYKISRL
jgi:hypothetical protein